MRSRTVSRTEACWRSTRSSPPILRASSSRRRSSSSSGSQDTAVSLARGGAQPSARGRSARERLARGPLTELLDGRALALAAFAQALETCGVEPRLLGCDLEERRPEPDLPRDAGHQPFELHDPAERRI